MSDFLTIYDLNADVPYLPGRGFKHKQMEGRSYMTVYDAIMARRTIRKFTDDEVSRDTLVKLIDCARVAPYGANLQPLKFRIITDESERRDISPMIKYAGAVPDWDPTFEETAPAFIAVVNDTSIKPTDKSECDSGAAVMSMILAAQAEGLATCWLGAIDRSGIKERLGLDPKYDITYLLAIGKPAQKGEIFEMTDTLKYHFDENGDLHVPKRKLNDIIL